MRTRLLAGSLLATLAVGVTDESAVAAQRFGRRVTGFTATFPKVGRHVLKIVVAPGNRARVVVDAVVTSQL